MTIMMTIDDYIASSPEAAQPILRRIRAMAAALCPEAQETISYRMPALRQGRVFFYFAGFKNHIGIYPPVSEPAELVEALKPYRGPKGNLQFRYADSIPYDLVERVIIALHAAHASERGQGRRTRQ